MTNDEFFESLSKADWDKAKAIETEIGNLLQDGLTERVAIKFVRTVFEVRTAVPGATVEGVFDGAMLAGLNYLGDERTLTRIRRGRFTEATHTIKPQRKPKAAKRGSSLK